jgi:hypothetical protein
MLKCPFCQFDNEDGALFCEQCKSDLATVVSTPAAPPVVAQAADTVPMAILEEAIEPITAEPASNIPVAMPEPIPFAGWEPATPAVAMPAAPFLTEKTPPMDEPIPLAGWEPAPPAVAVPATPFLTETPPMAEPIEVAPPATPVIPPLEITPVTPVMADTAPPVELIPPVAAFAEATPVTPAEAAPAAPTGDKLPADAKPMLVVIRGLKINHEFPIYPDLNFIGRADEKPVDIDLDDQEPPDRIWCSRQHALITFEDGVLTIEDLNSSNGTYVNRTRVYPGQKRQINVNDVIQIGTVQMKVRV